ncbi:MAG: hypothetical protein EXS03_06375 [Phycisphaerales bacterium]|nr:hypothetical protein [Phycisphaerales bacterium]
MINHATIVAFGLACVAAMLSPAWGLALVLTMYAFEQAAQASNMLFVRFVALANFCVAVSVTFGVVRNFLATPRLFHGYASPVWFGTVAIFAYSAASLFWTPARATAVPLLTGQIPYFVLFILIAPLLIDDIGSLTRFTRAFLFLGVAIVVMMLLNPAFTFYTGRLGFNLEATVRTNPLAMGELGGNILLAGALFRVGSSAWFTQLLRIGAFGLGAVLALQSGSRGQIIFAVLIALGFYPMAVRIKNMAGFFWSAVGAVAVIPIILLLGQYLLSGQELRRWSLEFLAGGSDVRVANVTELMSAWLAYPPAWFVGLGFNAFTAVSAARSEPYSHVLFVDLLAEHGIPMFILFCIVLTTAVRDAVWVFRRFADDPDARAALAVFYSFFAYQLLLVNKQGYIWAAMMFFFQIVTITRLRMRTEMYDYDAAEADDYEPDEVTEDHATGEGLSSPEVRAAR